MARGSYRVVGHTSEVALELKAPDLAGLCEAAALGLLELYGEPPSKGEESRRITLEASEGEGTLVAWMNELVYLIGTKRWIPRVFALKQAGGELVADLVGGPLDGKLSREIKAATFGGLAIRTLEGGSKTATLILDV